VSGWGISAAAVRKHLVRPLTMDAVKRSSSARGRLAAQRAPVSLQAVIGSPPRAGQAWGHTYDRPRGGRECAQLRENPRRRRGSSRSRPPRPHRTSLAGSNQRPSDVVESTSDRVCGGADHAGYCDDHDTGEPGRNPRHPAVSSITGPCRHVPPRKFPELVRKPSVRPFRLRFPGHGTLQRLGPNRSRRLRVPTHSAHRKPARKSPSLRRTPVPESLTALKDPLT